MSIAWADRAVLVTGGASFIGSHLVDSLIALGAPLVRVVDDLSSGCVENISGHIGEGRIDFVRADLLDPGVAESVVAGIDVIFHLAAIHGGRGFVDLHQAECSRNMVLDGLVIEAARLAGVERFIFASSGCVYPLYKQTDPTEDVYLSEDMVGPPYDADGMYGWAKLMTELKLQAYHRDYGLRSASCRFFTVYGERGVENHAVMAMIARAFVRQDPFEVWGNGKQVRNWTHVHDIVRGMVLAAESIDDARAVNLGTDERTSVIDAVQEVCRYMNHTPTISFRPDMPIGPANRVADTTLAAELLGWRYQVPFLEGLHRTIDWYVGSKEPSAVDGYLERMLTER
jgi:nucleoside-diphosphate-sugar epimerase